MKYVVEDTTMTGIADAIRAKTSSATTLTPAQMIEAIASITGGGDGSSSEYIFAEGSFIPASEIETMYNEYNDKSCIIEHGLGVTPNIVTVWAEITEEDAIIPLGGSFIFATYMPFSNFKGYMLHSYNGTGGCSSSEQTIHSSHPIFRLSDTEIKVSSNSLNALFYEGRKYYWVAAYISSIS